MQVGLPSYVKAAPAVLPLHRPAVAPAAAGPQPATAAAAAPLHTLPLPGAPACRAGSGERSAPLSGVPADGASPSQAQAQAASAEPRQPSPASGHARRTAVMACGGDAAAPLGVGMAGSDSEADMSAEGLDTAMQDGPCMHGEDAAEDAGCMMEVVVDLDTHHAPDGPMMQQQHAAAAPGAAAATATAAAAAAAAAPPEAHAAGPTSKDDAATEGVPQPLDQGGHDAWHGHGQDKLPWMAGACEQQPCCGRHHAAVQHAMWPLSVWREATPRCFGTTHCQAVN